MIRNNSKVVEVAANWWGEMIYSSITVIEKDTFIKNLKELITNKLNSDLGKGIYINVVNDCPCEILNKAIERSDLSAINFRCNGAITVLKYAVIKQGISGEDVLYAEKEYYIKKLEEVKRYLKKYENRLEDVQFLSEKEVDRRIKDLKIEELYLMQKVITYN